MSEDDLKIEITDAEPSLPREDGAGPGNDKDAGGRRVGESRDQDGFQVTDRRFWVQDANAVERASSPPERLPSYIEELKARTEAAEGKLREKISQVEADNEAYRMRLRRDMENRAQQQVRQTLEGFLEVLDNLERALEAAESTDDSKALQEGVRLNLQLFLDKLKAAGIQPIEVQGLPFDPRLAESVGVVPVDSPEADQTVVEVVQKGYIAGDQLVRPARVRIGQYTGQ